MTGGGPETWEPISRQHMDQYARYAPIDAGHSVVEVGCGVGRDAIQLTSVLDERGRYYGVDIIRPSIEWCQRNITARFPNFTFGYLDVLSPIHNPLGKLQVTDVRFSVPDASVDRILLQSVFTHMFRPDVVHYLHEFRRILKPGGKVFASLFVLDEETLAISRASGGPFRFEHPYGPGTWINDLTYPESSVGYNLQALDEMLEQSGLTWAEPVHRGAWSGRKTWDAQDVAIWTPKP
jgi:SAM-dependent methyltransferase